MVNTAFYGPLFYEAHGEAAHFIGDPVLPVARILEEAECGPSVKRLKNLFDGHPTWQAVIRESGSNAWLEV